MQANREPTWSHQGGAARGLLVAALAIAAIAAVATFVRTGPADTARADAAVQAIADDWIDHWYLPENPSAATQLGVHAYDDQLDDYTAAGVQRHAGQLRGYLARLEAVPAAGLSQHAADDREMLANALRDDLLGLEEIRGWQKNPDTYPSGITNAVYVIMQREYAPVAERLAHVIAREQAMPAALEAGRANLVDPPRIWTEIAIQQLPGAVSFFRNDLPQAFAGVADPGLQARFKASNAAVIAALESYGKWLKDDLLPRSQGEFRLGADLYRRHLAYAEMVDTPIDELLRVGMDDLRRNQAEFARVASHMEPGKPVAQVLDELGRYGPPPAKLLQAFRDSFDGITRFIAERQLVTIPEAPPPVLRETPPFMRATTFASMDVPGPFEQVAKESYYSVTLPEPSWNAARTAGFMAQFSYPVISNVTVHEAYPGHYVQGLWSHRNGDRLRQVLGANTYVEGWAHYCEQMAIEEGFAEYGHAANDTRAADMARLGQLQDALLRNARYIVALRMHAQGMSMEDAVRFFVDEGYQSKEVGEAEVKRGTADALYLYYTLGKLQILKLRDDLKAKEGAAFTLRSFHDRLLQVGQPPLRIVRRELLGSDGQVL